jgi:divalent metal cation (Fe/Co/Zn/Cd) transporter
MKFFFLFIAAIAAFVTAIVVSIIGHLTFIGIPITAVIFWMLFKAIWAKGKELAERDDDQ